MSLFCLIQAQTKLKKNKSRKIKSLLNRHSQHLLFAVASEGPTAQPWGGLGWAGI